MKKRLSFILPVFFLGSILYAQQLPYKSEVLNKMELANDYFMAKWPDPVAHIITDKDRPSNIWTRSTYYEGLMAMYRISPLEKYYTYAVDWGEGNNWELAWGGTTSTHSDNQCCGQVYIELYELDQQSGRIAGIKNAIDLIVAESKVDYWTWIDAIQMSMPIYAKLGVVYDDVNYFNKMYDLYISSRDEQATVGFYNETDHLWYRDKNFIPPLNLTPNGYSTYWSRGNGWVFAALTRVLEVLPEDESHRDLYIDDFKSMADALINVQREDGFWNVSLFDPLDYGGPETSGTGFFIFGLAWGVNSGLLDEETYMPSVIKGWEALSDSALHDDGFLGYVQGTGDKPSSSQPVTYNSVPNFEDFGLGAFLLAGSEVYKMAPEDPTNLEYSKIYDVNVYSSGNHNLVVNIHLKDSGNGYIDVYDCRGVKMKTILNGNYLGTGIYNFSWNYSNNISKGVYIIKVHIGKEVVIRRVIMN